MDLQKVELKGMDWIDLAQDMDGWRGSCKRGNEPSGSAKHGDFVDCLRTG